MYLNLGALHLHLFYFCSSFELSAILLSGTRSQEAPLNSEIMVVTETCDKKLFTKGNTVIQHETDQRSHVHRMSTLTAWSSKISIGHFYFAREPMT